MLDKIDDEKREEVLREPPFIEKVAGSQAAHLLARRGDSLS